ncbi:MAG TPA: hypothetical protein VNT51_06225 [Miltoncostaeaceae bacterium]|nr:hypothetical protein [Miltoncostaeaceae bacterium]
MNLIPRLGHALGALALSLVSRSLHCHAGLPRRWLRPPGWM